MLISLKIHVHITELQKSNISATLWYVKVTRVFAQFYTFHQQIIINNLTRVGSKEFRASRARASGSVEEGGSRSVKFLSMRLRVWCRSCASAF